MMKNAPNEPKSGDYCICSVPEYSDMYNFIENSIGHIWEITSDNEYGFYVEYEKYSVNIFNDYDIYSKELDEYGDPRKYNDEYELRKYNLTHIILKLWIS